MSELEQKTEDLCEICVGEDDKVSEMFCRQCEQNYCESCSKAHLKMRISSSHKLVRLEELKKAQKRKQDLQAALSFVEEKWKVLNSRKISFFDNIKNVEIEICEEADRRLQLIKNEKQKLLSLLQKIKTHHEREIDELNQELTQAKELLSTSKDHCDELLKTGSDVYSLCIPIEELVNMKDLEDCWRKLGALVVPKVIFSASSVAFGDTTSALGELEADNPQLLFTLNQAPVYSDGRPLSVFGVAMLDKYLCVVYVGNNTVNVFDCEDRFKKIKVILINKMGRPIDMVGCSVTSQLFISDRGSGNIFRVNVNTGVSDVFIEFGQYYATLSLVENRLLVTLGDRLFMCDIYSCQRTKKIPLTEDMKKNEVVHVIESNKDSFFVCHGLSNAVTNTVSEIDSEGRVIRVFDNKDQLNCGHLALDSVGRLLVADWKNYKVVLLDEYLQFIKILLGKERLDGEGPERLSYNKNNNRLAVGLNNGQVKIFDCNV